MPKWNLWSQVTLCTIPKGLACLSLLHMFSLQLILSSNSSQPFVTCVLPNLLPQLCPGLCCSVSWNRMLGNQHQLLQNNFLLLQQFKVQFITPKCSTNPSVSITEKNYRRCWCHCHCKNFNWGRALPWNLGSACRRYFIKFINTKPGPC